MIYQEWFNLSPEEIPANLPLSERIENYIRPNDRVLDIGCGDGRLYGFFASKGCFYYGIDVNRSAIEAAQRRFHKDGNTFLATTAEDTGLLSASFEILIAQGILACMDLEGRTKAVEEMRRVAKVGAILHITELNLLNDKPYYQAQRQKTKEYGTVMERPDGTTFGYTTHHFSRGELGGLLGRDWKILVEEYPLLTTRNGNQYPAQRLIVQKINC